jgi:hypothetical protein
LDGPAYRRSIHPLGLGEEAPVAAGVVEAGGGDHAVVGRRVHEFDALPDQPPVVALDVAGNERQGVHDGTTYLYFVYAVIRDYDATAGTFLLDLNAGLVPKL